MEVVQKISAQRKDRYQEAEKTVQVATKMGN